jgi:hypothetical protein
MTATAPHAATVQNKMRRTPRLYVTPTLSPNQPVAGPVPVGFESLRAYHDYIASPVQSREPFASLVRRLLGYSPPVSQA